ncbi:hypothetical protein KK001_22990 [Enterobacter roggenkampii]|uniref:hypothetical protein n=1 Tax=Enterobacter roggenkampii TaxID=1812935 RepID=UPI0013FD0A29|nr:hypothetical protein [Enterobacter roggenkampii]MBT1891174.1 hypothetical protein [Enterobacter roggenkampii]HAT7712952.1 hypothetical protein [Enterobacter hormaechei subsp. steigerwaltii]
MSNQTYQTFFILLKSTNILQPKKITISNVNLTGPNYRQTPTILAAAIRKFFMRKHTSSQVTKAKILRAVASSTAIETGVSIPKIEQQLKQNQAQAKAVGLAR